MVVVFFVKPKIEVMVVIFLILKMLGARGRVIVSITPLLVVERSCFS